MEKLPTAEDVLAFWFEELEPKQHFVKDQAVDFMIAERFGGLHAALAKDDAGFTASTRGKLAAIIVFDQFSRNMFRDDRQAFAFDGRALALAQTLVADGVDKQFTEQERIFLYMPYMHAEDLAVQDECVRLYEALGVQENIPYAHAHRDVIASFGRFPHRNAALGRVSTPEEIVHIATPGTAF